MRKPSRTHNSTRPRLPKRAEGQRSSHEARTQIEESVVWLHALTSYSQDELTKSELDFLEVAKRNLARMHRRLSSSPH
jgi:hypothetical protein